MKPAAAFVCVCALAIPLWWIALFQFPPLRQMFVGDQHWPAFAALMLPDLLLALATAAFAWRLWRARATPTFGGLVLGGWVYATALAIAWASPSPALWLGPALMMAATIGLAVICYVQLSSRASRSHRP